jgi:cGMP-dependent protein kinase
MQEAKQDAETNGSSKDLSSGSVSSEHIHSWLRELICCGYKSKGIDTQGFAAPIVPLMKRLSQDDRREVAKVCHGQEFHKGTVVISQGDIGQEFFLINDGEALVTKKGQDGTELTLVTLRKGDYFGENALLFDEPRQATVTATTALSVLKISRQDFTDLGLHTKLQFAKRKAVGGGEDREIETKEATPKTDEDMKFIADALKQNENLQTMLENLNEESINELIKLAWTQEFEAGETVIEAGDLNADYFYVVKEGSFEVSARTEESMTPTSTFSSATLRRMRTVGPERQPQSIEEAVMAPMEVGGCFGELALLYLTPRTATVKAKEDSVVWVIDRQNFKKVLMMKSEERIAEYASLLDSVEILKCLEEEEKKELANAFVEMQYQEGEIILNQGEPGKVFYVLYDGEVSISKDGKEVNSIKTRGAYFGERALLSEEPRTATVTVKSANVRVLALDQESFNLLLGSLQDLMKDSMENKAPQRNRAKSAAWGTIIAGPPQKKISNVIEFEDLQKIGLLGNGGFGCVELVKNAKTGETYALKSMGKGHIVKVGMQNAVVNEKNVLLLANSPFIVKLHATYNWPETVAFLLEVLLGGELYATYTRENLWGQEVHARFYASIVILGFAHLHSHHILYRDLKPENIVLNSQGMPKLVDMGLAKRVVGKTYTTCGTPDYFAPEVITGAGHNHAVDWWTIGILIYELLSGNPPFTASAPMQIFKNVLGGIKRVALPKKCQGPAGHLIKGLLRKEPSERLPMRAGGVPEFKKHEWYASFDWDALEREDMTPPYRPSVKSDTDMANFSAREEDKPQEVPFQDDGSGWDLEFDMTFMSQVPQL